ncbi:MULTISPECIES: gamma-glutamyltransferase family protein [Brucella/Ochrobactrum group]|uniref:gamma-glutamyltransferase family protein n=1 Tax=Brucella/Ochrobactrum group TaxID=2826938 RepID=UPI001655F940|nr:MULTISPECIES: gamma-glutamyltransferase [Brucella/Ochrobactrum group]MBC8719887.1 gamma-glutamyltransferase [Ochrobactrum sp. Marseille-Q0166]
MAESWAIQKKQSVSEGGMVACQNWLAADAGAAALRRGGNAMDAAVTTALVLSVVEPWLSGVGGGGFLLHADGKKGTIDALDFNVVSPRNIDPDDYRLAPGSDGDWFNWPKVVEDRNLIGYSSICVPGAIAGLASALERFGSISFADALQPAIQHAQRGLQIDWFTTLCLAIDSEGLNRFPPSSALFLDHGRAPRVPETDSPHSIPMPKKAAMLERLANAGARDFYEGEIAEKLVKDLRDGGCRIDKNDLIQFEPQWKKPLTIDYHGSSIHAMPGLSGGPTLKHVLEELSRTLPSENALSGKTALAFARAIRRASEERLRTLGHGSSGESCTTHISVVDRDGTMVSLTNTLLSRFGSKVVLPSLDLLMNNGMMWFDPRPGQPNSIAAGVKPLANMCPIITCKDGSPHIALGAAGGRQIMPAVAQILSYIDIFGMSPEVAFHAPRIDASGVKLRVSERAQPNVAARLSEEFPVEIIGDTLYPVNFSIPSVVMREDGHNIGMAHPYHPWAAVSTEEA